MEERIIKKEKKIEKITCICPCGTKTNIFGISSSKMLTNTKLILNGSLTKRKFLEDKRHFFKNLKNIINSSRFSILKTLKIVSMLCEYL